MSSIAFNLFWKCLCMDPDFLHHYRTGCRPCRPASQIAPRELSDCTERLAPHWLLLNCRVWLTDWQSLLKGKEWTPTRAPAISLLVKLAATLHYYPPTTENIDNPASCQCQCFTSEEGACWRLPVLLHCWQSFSEEPFPNQMCANHTVRTFAWENRIQCVSLKKQNKAASSKNLPKLILLV